MVNMPPIKPLACYMTYSEDDIKKIIGSHYLSAAKTDPASAEMVGKEEPDFGDIDINLVLVAEDSDLDDRIMISCRLMPESESLERHRQDDKNNGIQDPSLV